MRSWNLDFNIGRSVRTESPLAAPCGCVGKSQTYNVISDPDLDCEHHDYVGVVECIGCGATWDTFESERWEDFGEGEGERE